VIAQTPDRADQPNIAAEAPAHVSFVDGSAVLERDGQRDASPENMPLLSGDRVRTQNGRVEILFGDGSTLHMDTDTIVDFQSNEPCDCSTVGCARRPRDPIGRSRIASMRLQRRQ
jgi:hypothetical protein